MKRQLFTTTALVTAGVLASSVAHAEEGIKLGIGGYMNNYFGAGDYDNDGNDFNETSLWSDGEVIFTGETTLDNGLSFGANIQLESFASGDQIDENFGYIEGGFGRFQFGSENTAAHLMQYSAPQVGAPISTGWVTNFIPTPAGFSAFAGPFQDIGNDDNTLTYFTPRLFGFQLGVSYTPNVQGNGEGSNAPADEDVDYHDGVSVGLNFVESFGGFDVALAGGYKRASAPDNCDVTANDPRNTATTNGASRKVFVIDCPDQEIATAGINLGFAGVTIGGGVAAEYEGRVTPLTRTVDGTVLGDPGAGAVLGVAPFAALTVANSTRATYTSDAESTEGWSWDAGISYSTGPWSFSGVYQWGTREGSVETGDNDYMTSFGAAVEYAVGPGIRVNLTGMYASYDGESGADNDGYAGVAGISFGF